MADIAMLIVEEYERRVRKLRTAGIGADGERQFDMTSCVSVLGQMLMDKIGESKRELVKWVCEPKSQIGVAASNSFFSA